MINNKETDQDLSFSLADKLDHIFDIKYIGSDKPEYAYEIESQIRSILLELNLKIIKL